MSLAALKQRLADITPPPRAVADALPSGIDALDRALPDGGIPRGRLTELLGPRGSGKTTVSRQIVAAARARGIWVAWIDAARTLAPRDWAHLATDGFWVIRPPESARAPWCADVLLRSGAFGLVVLDGAPPLSRSIAVRLTRIARDVDSAFLAIGDERGASLLPGAIRLSSRRRRIGRRADAWPVPALDPVTGAGLSPPPSRIAITIEKGGSRRTVEVSCAVAVARRLCTYPEIPDRRGVGRSPVAGRRSPVTGSRLPAGVAAGSGAGDDPATGHRRPATGHRKRRCAEPTLGRPGAVLPARIGEGCGAPRVGRAAGGAP